MIRCDQGLSVQAHYISIMKIWDRVKGTQTVKHRNVCCVKMVVSVVVVLFFLFFCFV